MRCYLVAHEASVSFIRRTIDFLTGQLSRHHGAENCFAITVPKSVDEAGIEGPAIVYIIGERLAPFTRRPDCFYVYLNFSVVAMIGNPLRMSRSGAKMIREKRWLLRHKLEQVDLILDYYPAQTRALQGKLSKPVLGFLPCSERARAPNLPLAEREFDLCFVGGVSPRRKKVLDAAAAAGLSLSPSRGADLEDLTARSRLTLNVHMQASNHLEIPRIVGSLSTATPIVTEHSHGLSEIVVSDSVCEGRAKNLIPMAQHLLADPQRLIALQNSARQAFEWYYQNACTLLEDACHEIKRRATDLHG